MSENGQSQDGQERSPLQDAAGAGGADQAAKPVRPEGLADDYWNEESGVDLPKLLGSHKELADFKAAQDAAVAGRPQKPEEYKAALPDDFEAPQGVEVTIDENDPRLGPARELAHEFGLTQEQFSKLIALDAQSKIGETTQMNERMAQELKKLGTNGKARVDGVTTWLSAKLGNDLANSLNPMIFTEKQVKAFEKLISASKGAVPDFQGGGREEPTNGLSDEEWSRMSLTQQTNYAHEHNATKRVQAASGRG